MDMQRLIDLLEGSRALLYNARKETAWHRQEAYWDKLDARILKAIALLEKERAHA